MYFTNMYKEEALGGLVSYNDIFLCVAFLVLLHFIIDWIISYKRTGWTIDPWHFTILMSFILTTVLQYPFISSIANFFALGPNWKYASNYAEANFFINLLGYVFLLIGGVLYKHTAKDFRISLNCWEKIIQGNINSTFILRGMAIFMFLLTCLFVIWQVQKGILFQSRLFFLSESPSYRALFNGLGSTMHIIIAYCICRVVEFRNRIDILLTILLILSSMFLGGRSLMLSSVLSIAIMLIYKNKGKINLKKCLIFLGLLISLFFAVTYFRDGKGVADGSANIETTLMAVFFYGNSFSDLRDGAVVISGFNGDYLFGNTYIAALMSFIPRVLSDFREHWAFGVVTAGLAGYDTSVHPGMRMGMFGEPFLNFGYLGVCVVGLILGYFLKRVDTKTKYIMNKNGNLIVMYVGTLYYGLFVSPLTNSSGFFFVYTFIIVNAMFYFIRLLIIELNKHS